MREFFLGQLDYVFFVYGLAFILLSSVCVVLYKKDKALLPWYWLGAFGLIHGLNEWMDMLALSLGDSAPFNWVRIAVMGVSFVCLFEFGRSVCGRFKYVRIRRWIYMPLFLAVFFAVPAGMAGVNAAVRYSFGLSGGLLTAFALWKFSEENKERFRPLAVAAIAMAVYTVAAGLIVPKAALLAAGFINHDAFLQAAGFPVQILCAFAACVFTAAIWRSVDESRGGHSVPRKAGLLKDPMTGAILVAVVMLATGWIWTQQLGQREAVLQRAQLLSDAQQSVSAVDSGLVSSLFGSAADISSPMYQVVKSRLQNLRKVMASVRFIYLMRKTDGKIIFLADSEQAGSKDESPPGQVYDDVTPKLEEVFATGKGGVDEPATDPWGRWISAYAPINDGRTGEMIALLGVDQSAHDFVQAVARARFHGIVPVAVFCFGVLFVFVYWRRFKEALEQGQEGQPVDLWVRYGMAVIVAGFGLILTGVFFFELRYDAERNFRTIFLQRSIVRMHAVSEELERQIDRLDGLRRFLDSQESVDRNEFSDYVGPLLKDIPIQAVEWVPRVSRGERVFYESSAKQDGMDGFGFYEKDASGRRVPASDREEYFPVYYLEPLKNNEVALGYDLSTEPVRRAAMEKCRDLGLPVATPPLELVQKGNKRTGIIVFMPVYAKDVPRGTVEHRRKGLKGFVLEVYNADDFIKGIYSKMPPEGLACLIEDQAAPPDRRVLYRHAVREGTVDWDRPLLKYEMPLEIPDRQWRATLVPSTAFIERNLSRAYWWVLAFGAFLSAIVALLLNVLMTARFEAERMVKLRTDELTREKESLAGNRTRLELAIEGSQAGVWDLNVQTGEMEVSERWAEITGHTLAELAPVTLQKRLRLMHPDDRERSEELLQRHLDGKTDFYDCEVRIKHKNGQWVWTHDRGRATGWDKTGKAVRASGTLIDVTERKLAAEALQASEKRFLDVMYASKDAILLISGNNFADANEAAARMLGYASREEFLTVHPSKLSPSHQSDGRSSFEKAEEMIRLAAEKGFHQFEWVHRRANGEDLPVQVSLTPITLQGKHVLYCVWTDLTQRKRDEKNLLETQSRLQEQSAQLEGALKESRNSHEVLVSMLDDNNEMRARFEETARRVELILSSTGEGIFGLDKEGRHTFVNPQALKMLGYTEQEMVGKVSHPLIHHSHPDGSPYPGSECPNLKVFFGGKPNHGEEYYWRKDGTGFPVESSAVPLVENGETVGIVVSFRDITERKKADEELRKLSRAVEQSSATIVITDLTGAIEYVNPQFTRTTGYTFEEAKGKNPRVLKSGEMPPEGYKKLWDTLLAGEEWRGEFHNKKKNGQLYWETAAISPIRNVKGEVTHFLAVKEDITEQKRQQQQMDLLVGELKSSNAEMTKLVKQLKDANFRVEMAMQAKGQFLANMSHEIRTPMNAILGFLELLRNTPLNEQQKDYLETVSSSGEVLLAIINDILDLSKIQAGEVKLENIDFNLEHLVEDVVRMIRPKVAGRSVQLLYHIGEGVPHNLSGDPTRLRQVLLNLLSNASKFTEHGEIELRVELEKVADGAPRLLRCSVRDSGIGIPKDKQESIFDHFTQVDASTTRKYGGTGLGLSICRNLVQLLGGKIWVESSEGKGSTFIFTMKFSEGSGVAKTAVNPINIEELRGRKVLVVDDQPKAVQMLRLICQENGMIVMEALSGKEALEKLSQCDAASTPGLALLDIMMPEMDGYELARKIRSHPEWGKMKIIAATSDVRVGIAEELKKNGFDAFLPKPITKRELLSVIRTVLGDQREGGGVVTRHMAQEFACKGMKVLVAEDNPVNRKLMQVLLKNLGCEAECVENGQEAVDKVRANDYDVVLMDLQMPVMGGVEATQYIRKDVAKIVPIIALTAAVLQEDRDRSLKAGMNDFLTKPVKTQELKDVLLRWGKRGN